MIDELKILLHANPFTPFRIVTASGDKYIVQNPDEVALGKVNLFIYTGGGETFSFVRNSQITALESVAAAA